jgi:cell division protein FtsN
VLVAVPLKTDLFKSKIEATTMNPLVTAEFEHNKKAVDDGIKDESAKVEENIKQISEEPSAPEVIVPVTAESNVYFLITGSFKSEENAISQANMLKTEGFDPEIVPAPNGFYRVSAMMGNDLNTAKARRDSISKKYPGTWISKKR